MHTDRLDDIQLVKAEGGNGQQAHLPYSLSPPRPDRDQKDGFLMVFGWGEGGCSVFARLDES